MLGISAGQAVANVKLASVNPALRNEIRQSAEGLQLLEQRISYQNLVYELERIYTYLITELANPTTKGYIPLQDRLNVAEYGLLESQVESCSRDLNSKGVLDADILAVIAEQMIDFKRRLGIDYYVAGLTYDREAITRWLNDLYVSSKVGLMFYVKGCRLFWNDILYCASLIGRAVQGVTLKPREVRTIRYVMSLYFLKVSTNAFALTSSDKLFSPCKKTKQTYFQRCDHVYPRGHYSDYSTFTSRARSRIRCYPTILPRFFPKLFHRATTKLITAIRNNGIFRGHNQGEFTRETQSIRRSPRLFHCQQISEFVPKVNKYIFRGDR